MVLKKYIHIYIYIKIRCNEIRKAKYDGTDKGCSLEQAVLMTETIAHRMASSRRGLWRPEGPTPANVRVSGKDFFCFCFAVRSKRRWVLIFLQQLLTLQSSLESQTQQAWNDDIMEASPRLFSVLSSFCYLLEAVTGQHHLIHWKSGATWIKLWVVHFSHFTNLANNEVHHKQVKMGPKWTAYSI